MKIETTESSEVEKTREAVCSVIIKAATKMAQSLNGLQLTQMCHGLRPTSFFGELGIYSLIPRSELVKIGTTEVARRYQEKSWSIAK